MLAEISSIIAVSGLGGHAFGSFKARGGEFMWLHDSLCKSIRNTDTKPMARILVFGHDSTVHNSENTQSLEGIASFLRGYLLQLARLPGPMKPIVFIGHSLGGLIIKQVRKDILNPT